MFEELDQLLHSDMFDTALEEEVIHLQDGERREVAILFADIQNFTTLTERLDPEQLRMVVDKLMQLFTLCIEQYGGYIDKYEGDLVMALFGAKLASERDTERVILAALLMLEKLKQFNTLLMKNSHAQGLELRVRIGINIGLVTTGRVGAKREGDFTVYGEAVNLARRIEENAPVNRIMVSAEIMQLVRETFEFETYDDIDFKSRSKTFAVFLVKGLKAEPVQRWNVKRSAYVGRDRELAVLHEKYDLVGKRLKESPEVQSTKDLENHKPIVVGIKAPAGFGKSRLIYEFLQSRRGFYKRAIPEVPTTRIFNISSPWFLYGTTPRITQNPYCVFTSLIKHALDISQIDSPKIVKEKLEAGVSGLHTSLYDGAEGQDLREMLPIVGSLLGVKYEDIRLQLTGKELQSHFHTAIRYFLETAAVRANLAGMPLLVVLEDLQWLDEASRMTLDVLMRTLNVEGKRQQKRLKHLIFLLAYRSEYEVPDVLKIEAAFSELELSALDEDDADALIQSMIGDITLPPTIKQQVMEKSEGNPFYLEEWVNLIEDLPAFENLADLPVPSSLTALVLSRIDRLEHDVKLLLQKAAVVGKEFFVKILEEIEKKLHRPENISPQLNSLEASDFIRRMLGAKYSTYLFKHIMTQEVAYNTLLFVNRRILHHITAEVIEEQFSESIEEFYYDLAEHYSKAEVLEKTIEYLEKAGDKAKASYENEKALDFYDRLLFHLQGFDDLSGIKIDTLLKKGEVLQLVGAWERCEQVCAEAFRDAERIDDTRRIGESHWALSIILRLQGKYEKAITHCEASLALFHAVGEQVGISKAFGNLGNIHLLQGNYDEAMTCYKRALTIKEALNDKAGISYDIGNMGGVYYDKGDYKAAMTCYQKKFKICEELGDKLGLSRALGYMGNVYYSQGDLKAAKRCYEQDLRICEELGDKLGISKAVYHLGNVHYNRSDYEAAIACYEKNLQICEELGYKMGISASNGIMGFIHKEQGDYDAAMAYFKKVLMFQEDLGDKRSIATSVGNMGVIYLSKGEYQTAMACFEEDLTISEELGYKKGISLAVYHMGIVHRERGDYETAIACYDRAITIGKEAGIKPFLCGYLLAKAEICFLQQRFDEARTLSVEGLAIAEEIGRKERVFQGNVLVAKIDFVLGQREKAVALLSEMLAQTDKKVEQADLHYELYQWNVDPEEHRKQALKLYQGLYGKTPKSAWKRRITELGDPVDICVDLS